jgi:hypothetical protein
MTVDRLLDGSLRRLAEPHLMLTSRAMLRVGRLFLAGLEPMASGLLW